MKNFFLLATNAMITVKCFLPNFLAAVISETYSFIKTMQPISPNYNWEIRVKQIKITEENLSQSCISCQLLRTIRIKTHQTFFFYFYYYLPYIYWVDVIHLTYLVFVKSLWWLVWIFCAPNLLTWKTKLRKQNIRKYFVAYQNF